MQAYLYVVLDGKLGEQADILEGSGNSQLVELPGFFPAGVYAVYQYDAVGWLVNVGQQVKYGGLARTVRAYKAGYLGAAQHYTEILNGVQTAEVYPKAVYLKYGF